MKLLKKAPFLLALVIGIFINAACNKNSSATIGNTNTSLAAIQAAAVQTQAVSVAVSTTTAGDSIYAVHTCGSNEKHDNIAFSNLPASILNYLSSNYASYVSTKAFTLKDKSGTITGYVAVISFNSNPIALKFDASGNFAKVLELRDGVDLLGEGWHEGGDFDHRDGRGRDTVGLSSIPATITNYLINNYPTDTIVKAFKNRDGGYLLITKNTGLYATSFNASGTFISRNQLEIHEGQESSIDQSALSTSIASYLSTTYPSYVFEKAFVIKQNGNVVGYCVIIDANNIKYGVAFDASGNFVKAKVLR